MKIKLASFYEQCLERVRKFHLPQPLALAALGLLILAVLVLSLLLAFSGEGKRTVATVNGEIITQDDLNEALFELHGESVLELLVTGILVRQEAVLEDIIVSEEELDDEISRFAWEVLSMTNDDFYSYIERQGQSLERVRQMFESQLYLQKIALSRFDPDEEELRDFYDQRAYLFGRVEEIEVRHVLLDNEEEAKEVAELLRGGADFVAIAAEYSLDGSTRDTGGYLGYYSQVRMPPSPEFAEAAFALPVGVFSDPVQSDYGFHVIQVLGRIEPEEIVFENIRGRVRDMLIEARLTEVMESILEELIEKAKIEYSFE